MGVSVFLVGSFYRAEWSVSTVEATHRVLQASAFESAPTKGPDIVRCRVGPERAPDREYMSMDAFTRDLEAVGEGQVFYQYDPGTLRVTYRADPGRGDMPMPIGFSGLKDRWFDPDEHGSEAVATRVEALVDVFWEVACVVDPDLAFLLLFNDHGHAETVPEAHHPPEHGLEALPFLLVLSEPWIEYCGGREHVLDAPVYETEALDTGSILVRAKQRPSLHGCHYDQGFQYLFGD